MFNTLPLEATTKTTMSTRGLKKIRKYYNWSFLLLASLPRASYKNLNAILPLKTAGESWLPDGHGGSGGHSRVMTGHNLRCIYLYIVKNHHVSKFKSFSFY